MPAVPLAHSLLVDSTLFHTVRLWTARVPAVLLHTARLWAARLWTASLPTACLMPTACFMPTAPFMPTARLPTAPDCGQLGQLTSLWTPVDSSLVDSSQSLKAARLWTARACGQLACRQLACGHGSRGQLACRRHDSCLLMPRLLKGLCPVKQVCPVLKRHL